MLPVALYFIPEGGREGKIEGRGTGREIETGGRANLVTETQQRMVR